MKVLPSPVEDVLVHGPDDPVFEPGIVSILGRAPRDLLRQALPFSVIVENQAARGIALLGIRFDMLAPRGRLCSVVHYSDTLRNPSKGDFLPGAMRFICAEPEYTSLVLTGGSAAQTRGRMNLDNLRQMLSITASIDCLAFDDGRFVGPDSHGAYARFTAERATEMEMAEEAISRANDPLIELENWLSAGVQDSQARARRLVARKLLEALDHGGPPAMAEQARAHRPRIALQR